MISELSLEDLAELVEKQLKNYWNFSEREEIRTSLPITLKRLEQNLLKSNSKYCWKNNEVEFHIEHTVSYTIFLYLLSNQLYRDGFEKTAAYVYYLNKIMHSVDWFYAVELPEYFSAEHPLSSVLGRATYGNYFFIYQGVTVGGNKKGDKIYYPQFGEHVIMYSDSKVIGNSIIGNHVIISANTYIKDTEIPSNSIVFGASPNLIIKTKSEVKIKEMTDGFWKMDGQ